MLQLFNDWYHRHFTDPQVAILAFLLFLGAAILFFIGDIIAPILAAIIIAYLLDGAVNILTTYKIPRMIALTITFSVFILFLIFVIFILAPLLLRQGIQFAQEIPGMFSTGQKILMQLPEKYPNLISEQQVSELLLGFRNQITEFTQQVVSFSLSSVSDLLTYMVYLIVVPLLIFFFLKDRNKMIGWFSGFLPRDRKLVSQVWQEMNGKIASYVRGKFVEIIIIWSISFVTFLVLDLNYAALLSFAVGISVLIPYVGAAIVTLPVAIVAYFQWGYSTESLYVLIAYGVIQFLDGNILVPFLFSEMVNLHPAAIIVAVLLFGGLWGIWGVFFAIPLATLIHAVINSWPNKKLSNE